MNFYSIDRSILIKAIYNAVEETLIKRYEKNGYKVSKNYRIDNYIADLFCQNESESIVIEIRGTGMRNKGSIDDIITRKNKMIKKYKYKFKVEYFYIPQEKNIEVDDIENIIFQEIFENMDSYFDQLSTHTVLDEISNVEIYKIDIRKESIDINGTAEVGLELQWGSDADIRNDDGANYYKKVEIKFNIILSHDYLVKEFIYSPIIEDE